MLLMSPNDVKELSWIIITSSSRYLYVISHKCVCGLSYFIGDERLACISVVSRDR